jgi:hypothetical protein
VINGVERLEVRQSPRAMSHEEKGYMKGIRLVITWKTNCDESCMTSWYSKMELEVLNQIERKVNENGEKVYIKD